MKEDLITKMQKKGKKVVKNFKKDLEEDLREIKNNKNNYRYFYWFLRENGTLLIPEDEIKNQSSAIGSYLLEIMDYYSSADWMEQKFFRVSIEDEKLKEVEREDLKKWVKSEINKRVNAGNYNTYNPVCLRMINI